MKLLPLAALAAIGLAAAPIAQAAPISIIQFSQTSGSNTVTGTASATGTTFGGTSIAVSISQIAAALVTPIPAFLTLSATSTPAGATSVGGAVVEHFSGTFTVTQLAGGGGTNYLSGSFNDAAVTAVGSTAIGVFANTASFTSGVITTLGLPTSVSFGLTSVNPPVSLAACAGCTSGQTIGSFTAAVAGNASATPAPEPASLALLGVGLLGLGMVMRLRMH